MKMLNFYWSYSGFSPCDPKDSCGHTFHDRWLGPKKILLDLKWNVSCWRMTPCPGYNICERPPYCMHILMMSITFSPRCI